MVMGSGAQLRTNTAANSINLRANDYSQERQGFGTRDESLKIIFLNAWYGKLEREIGEFIGHHAIDTDIFCFQEVGGKMPDICTQLLTEYEEISDYKRVSEDDEFPQSTYVRNDIEIISSGTILKEETGTGLGLYIRVKRGKQDWNVCNLHGTSRPVNKLDDPVRIRQSLGVIDFFKDKDDPVIIGGDFNLFPDTKSIQMFSGAGYEDLIKQYGITTTRNHYAWDLYPDTPQHFSDYVFTKGAVSVREFSVPQALVSDHEPLILQVSAT